jgi:PPM family protein phosphatase
MIQLKLVGAFSKQGQRLNNEDCILATSDNDHSNIFLVCDGMGGHKKGEVASSIACKNITAFLSDAGTHEGAAKIITTAFKTTLEQLNQYANTNDGDGMGTTVTLVWQRNADIIIAYIGDSRVYQLRDDKIIYKTNDHSLVQKLINEHLITEEEARHHPKKNVVTRALVAGNTEYLPDIFPVTDAKTGDLFFMCTDGVIESLTDNDLVKILAAGNTHQEKMETIEKICAANSKDNYSAYLIEIV